LEQAILNATNAITGYSGGYVVLDPKNNPSRILVMDTPDKSTAQNVWQWNVNGLGHSSTGINGPYDVAITQNGSINAYFITSGLIDGNMIKAGSISSGSISQDYTNSVVNAINQSSEELRQSFTVADAQLESDITAAYTAMIEGDVETLTISISQLRQTLDALELSFATQIVGGSNKVQNSSGLNGKSDDWTYKNGVDALQNSEAQDNTISGSLFYLHGTADPNQAELSQDIKVIRDQMYTITFKIKRTTASRCYAYINNGENISYIFDEQVACNWTEYHYTFVATGDTVKFLAGTYGDGMLIADVIMVEGATKVNWQPAPNEIYTMNVKIDKRGINITNSESDTQTIIDNTQFAIKHQGNTVLTVNKDLTTLQKTQVVNELTVGKGRFVPKSNGLDFVLLD
jgi:hypothetical protein